MQITSYSFFCKHLCHQRILSLFSHYWKLHLLSSKETGNIWFDCWNRKYTKQRRLKAQLFFEDVARTKSINFQCKFMIITDDCHASLSFIFVFTIINWLLIRFMNMGLCFLNRISLLCCCFCCCRGGIEGVFQGIQTVFFFLVPFLFLSFIRSLIAFDCQYYGAYTWKYKKKFFFSHRWVVDISTYFLLCHIKTTALHRAKKNANVIS